MEPRPAGHPARQDPQRIASRDQARCVVDLAAARDGRVGIGADGAGCVVQITNTERYVPTFDALLGTPGVSVEDRRRIERSDEQPGNRSKSSPAGTTAHSNSFAGNSQCSFEIRKAVQCAQEGRGSLTDVGADLHHGQNPFQRSEGRDRPRSVSRSSGRHEGEQEL